MGALSKQVSRAVAKRVVGLPQFKQSIVNCEINTTSILYAIVEETSHSLAYDKLQITIRSQEGAFVLFEDEYIMNPSKEVHENIISPIEIEIVIDMKESNFSSIAYSRIL